MGRTKIVSMSKGTSIKDALSSWEKENEKKAAESEEIVLSGIMPPIEKIDASLLTLGACQKLSLSTNAIEKIANLNGLEAIGESLDELWISYNSIEKLRGIHVLKKLRVLVMSNNNVKDWGEFTKLADLPNLAELTFNGNPLEEKMQADGDYHEKVKDKINTLKKLDAVPIVREDEDDE